MNSILAGVVIGLVYALGWWRGSLWGAPRLRELRDRADAAAVAALRRAVAAEKVVAALKGECWCDFGTGNPVYRDHTAACKAAQALRL